MKPQSRHKYFFYRTFRAYFVLKERWQRRFTTAGKFTQLLLLLSAIIGVNTRQALAYQITGLLTAILALAWLNSRTMHISLRIRRRLPRYATAGLRFEYQLYIENTGTDMQTGLHLFEISHDPRPDFAQFCEMEEPLAAKRNWFDRTVGYYRWAWLVHINSVAKLKAARIPDLAAGAVQTISLECTPHARGILNIDAVAVARTDPFGLCQVYQTLPLPGSVLVLPKTYRLPPLPLPGNRYEQPEHPVNTVHDGDGEEIAGIREYRSGDAMRDIHWKSFARAGVPMVKEYQVEYFERYALLFDTGNAFSGDAFEEAVALAASFVGNPLYGNTGLLDLLFVGAECHCYTMGPGQLQAEALLRILAGVRASQIDAPQALLANIALRRAELSGCILIVPAWDAARQAMATTLQQWNLPLLIWLVSEEKPGNAPPWLLHLRPGEIEQGLARC